jgi:ribosomal protein S18 acetylase RimI-like enzyme
MIRTGLGTPVAAAARHRPVEVSPLRHDEHARLAELTLAAYRTLGPLGEGYAAELADVDGRAADPGVQVLAARIEGSIVGGVTVVLSTASPLAEHTDPEAAGMRMLAVDPGWHGRGVGRAMVRAALEVARRQGRRRVVLHTLPGNARAIRLYRSMGFVSRPELDLRTPGGLHLAALGIDLEPAARLAGEVPAPAP